MSSKQSDAVNAYAAAAELSYLRTDDGIAFAAMPAEAFVGEVEQYLARIENPSDEHLARLVQDIVQARLIQEIGFWGTHAQLDAITRLLRNLYRDEEVDEGGVEFVSSVVESLRDFIDSHSWKDAA